MQDSLLYVLGAESALSGSSGFHLVQGLHFTVPETSQEVHQIAGSKLHITQKHYLETLGLRTCGDRAPVEAKELIIIILFLKGSKNPLFFIKKNKTKY